MSDWHRCTPAEEALVSNCGPDEAIAYLDGRVVKLPLTIFLAMQADALQRATQDVLGKLGVVYTLETGLGPKGIGFHFAYTDGSRGLSEEFHADLATGHVYVDLKLTDGRSARGAAKLQRPQLH